MTLKLQCKKLWTTLFPSSILLLAFILMSFSLFFESLLYTTIRNAFSLFYFSVYQNVSSSMHSYIWMCMDSLHFWTHAFILMENIFAMDFFSHSFSLSRDDLAFFASVDDFVIHSMCAHNVLCSAFIQQRGIHLLFIFPFL